MSDTKDDGGRGHTPLPWVHHVDSFKVVHEPSNYIGSWVTVAICSTCDQATANAEFIVRAVNSFDAVVSALEPFASAADDYADCADADYVDRDATITVGDLRAARAAKARGGEQ